MSSCDGWQDTEPVCHIAPGGGNHACINVVTLFLLAYKQCEEKLVRRCSPDLSPGAHMSKVAATDDLIYMALMTHSWCGQDTRATAAVYTTVTCMSSLVNQLVCC